MPQSTNRASDAPLNGPEPELREKLRQLAGDRAPEDQGTLFNVDEIDNLGELTRTDVDQGNLIADDDDRPEDVETIEMLTELELRD
ncbi:MAG TPA: hypothetical protein VFX76_08950, partial [Roseiflexaceae bacterium]|nr:hypothetical protein [Roseiflexaceae bacterium]